MISPRSSTTLVFSLLSCALAWQASTAALAADLSTKQVDEQVAERVGRSTIYLGQPNLLPSQAMPLGNGRLGAAVWCENGLTVQLNRADTLPRRLSPGQVNIPGLAKLTEAKDYSGRLDLYNGTFVEKGGGMTATVYVQPSSDLLIIDVTGADPAQPQTVRLALWPPRSPHAAVNHNVGLLSESWIDDTEPGSSGLHFGSLAGISAEGRDVSPSVTDPRSVTLSVRPKADGSFRVLVAAPHFNDEQQPETVIDQELKRNSNENHANWWHVFWRRAGHITVTSPDGAGEYMENLRNIYLFSAAAESGDKFPGSQAGIGDLFSAVRDKHQWDPAAFWHWNLRMLVAANLGAGVPELNTPYFNLYRSNLANIEDWTRKHMTGRPGICVPETMRFNGQGIEYEDWSPKQVTGLNCDAGSKPYYNARTISTGAEVSFWVWQQYLQTGDRDFLAKNYPLLAASAQFLLDYEKRGPDGLLHTSPSNAHETQWDVTDPTTDLLARKSLYEETIAAATLLGKDAALVAQMRTALQGIPKLPRTEDSQAKTLLPTSTNHSQQGVITESYVPGAERHNVENIGLEPVWPYGVIGQGSSNFELAKRTYLDRPFPTDQDWSFDPVQAARLGLGDEVKSTLIKLTETYQGYVNGFANWGGDSGEFYVEQSAVVAIALQEALVQDYDGTIRIAPAIPPGWDLNGTVFVRGKTKVHVETTQGVPTKIFLEAGSNGKLTLRNPWPGVPLEVTGVGLHEPVVKNAVGPLVSFPAIAGKHYDIHKATYAHRELVPTAPIAKVSEDARMLGNRQIGLEAAAAQ